MMRWGDGSRKVVRVLDVPVLARRRRLGKSGRVIQGVETSGFVLRSNRNVVPRKASKLQSYETVPQTDTGGRDEYSKALERTREKELGKLVP